MNPGEKIVNVEITEDELKVDHRAPGLVSSLAPRQSGGSGELEDRRGRVWYSLA
jgi:hypothetical protein